MRWTAEARHLRLQSTRSPAPVTGNDEHQRSPAYLQFDVRLDRHDGSEVQSGTGSITKAKSSVSGVETCSSPSMSSTKIGSPGPNSRRSPVDTVIAIRPRRLITRAQRGKPFGRQPVFS